MFNKLVRSKIPDLIRKRNLGKVEVVVRHLESSGLNKAEPQIHNLLKNKLVEEVNEYISTVAEDDILEELADIMEVIDAISTFHGFSLEQVNQYRQAKSISRGRLVEKGMYTYLESVGPLIDPKFEVQLGSTSKKKETKEQLAE